MLHLSSPFNCPIDDMPFYLNESLTPPQDRSRRIPASNNLVIGMLTVDVTNNAALDGCSVCTEGSARGRVASNSLVGMSTTKPALPSGPYVTILGLSAVAKYSKRIDGVRITSREWSKSSIYRRDFDEV
ncbi:hypothetical protein TIFTF001_019788 [Ficus carica]|uniref:Uncharacterized protein n=1 Tax=Ficus carica TaxID=3494 RepID=A0AA88DJH0_FICCA|nr:hypothetical protein TIFTF001_019788 [Ficus carica]